MIGPPPPPGLLTVHHLTIPRVGGPSIPPQVCYISCHKQFLCANICFKQDISDKNIRR